MKKCAKHSTRDNKKRQVWKNYAKVRYAILGVWQIQQFIILHMIILPLSSSSRFLQQKMGENLNFQGPTSFV